MFEQLADDFSLLFRFVRKKYDHFVQKISFAFKIGKYHKEFKESRENVIHCLMEYEGAKKIGGEYMGKNEVHGCPILLYRIRRHAYDEPAYFYVAYIVRNERQKSYQVVLHEEWSLFNQAIQQIVKTNQPYFIGIKNGERGKAYAKRKTRFGRKTL